jgi:excisionase family DNA binding protein
MDDLLTTRQLMELLHLDRTTIYRMLNDGRLPGVRVGGQWRFSKQAVDSLLQGHNVIAEAAAEKKPTATPDVLPLHCLQPIQEVFAQTSGIGAVTTDLSGEPLIAFSNPCAYCSLILATEEGRKRCRASWEQLADQTEKHPRLEKCHAGLTYARGWINVEGAPVAMIFAGQFVVGRSHSSDSTEYSARMAQDLQLAPETLNEAARDIRVLTHERADQLLHLLQLVADTFSTIGQERLDLMQRLEKVAQIANGGPV